MLKNTTCWRSIRKQSLLRAPRSITLSKRILLKLLGILRHYSDLSRCPLCGLTWLNLLHLWSALLRSYFQYFPDIFKFVQIYYSSSLIGFRSIAPIFCYNQDFLCNLCNESLLHLWSWMSHFLNICFCHVYFIHLLFPSFLINVT